MKPKVYLNRRIKELQADLDGVVEGLEENKTLVQSGQLDKVDLAEFDMKMKKVIGLKMSIAELLRMKVNL